MLILKFTLLYFQRVFRFTFPYVYLQFWLFKYSELQSVQVLNTTNSVKKISFYFLQYLKKDIYIFM